MIVIAIILAMYLLLHTSQQIYPSVFHEGPSKRRYIVNGYRRRSWQLIGTALEMPLCSGVRTYF